MTSFIVVLALGVAGAVLLALYYRSERDRVALEMLALRQEYARWREQHEEQKQRLVRTIKERDHELQQITEALATIPGSAGTIGAVLRARLREPLPDLPSLKPKGSK